MPTDNYRLHAAPLILTDVTTQLPHSSQSKDHSRCSCCHCSFPFTTLTNSMKTQSLLRNQHSLRRVRNLHLMRTEVSSPSSQRPKVDPVLSQINPFHILSSHFSRINFNIFLQSTLASSKCSLIFRFSSQSCKYFFTLPCVLYKWPISLFVVLCIEPIVWPLSSKC